MTKPATFFAQEDVSGYKPTIFDDSISIHPIFAQANFHPDIDYASLQLALRVATLALQSSHSLDFLHLLFFAPRQPIDLSDGTLHWHIATEASDNAANTTGRVAVLSPLSDLSKHVHFIKSTPSSKVHTSCRPTPPTHGALLLSGGYGSIITLPHYDLDELSTLSIPHPTLPPDSAGIYLLSYKLVHSLLHELAHAIGHYTANQSSFLKEAFVGDDKICEFGFAYEIAVFGGTFDWVGSRGEVVYVYEDTEEKWMISLPGGTEKRSKRVVNILAVAAVAKRWDSVRVEEYKEQGFGLATRGEKGRKEPAVLWRLPFETIAKFFKREFWEVEVEEEGLKAFQLGEDEVGIERHDLPGGDVRYWLPAEAKMTIRQCTCQPCTVERERRKKDVKIWTRFGTFFAGGVTWEQL